MSKSSRFSVFGFGPKSKSPLPQAQVQDGYYTGNSNTDMGPPVPAKDIYSSNHPSVTSLSQSASMYGAGGSSSVLSLASTSATGESGRAKKSGFFSFKKRAKTPVQEPLGEGDAGISMPWNYNHQMHISEDLTGLPPSWTSSLAAAGFSPEEIQAIKAKKNAGNQYLHPDSRPSSPQAPVLAHPSPRTTSLPRQYSGSSGVSSYTASSHAPSIRSQQQRKYSDASEHSVDQSTNVVASSSRQHLPPSLDLNPSTPPPRRLLRVANGSAAVSPGASSPPPAYSGASGSGYRQEKEDSRSRASSVSEGEREDRRATVTQFTSQRHSPLYGLAGPSSSNESSSSYYNDEPTYDDEEEEDDDDDEDKRATILGTPAERRGTIKAPPPRLSLVPPRLSLHEADSSDLSSWSEALLSAIPSEGDLTPEPSPMAPRLPPNNPSPMAPIPPTKDRISIPSRSVSNPMVVRSALAATFPPQRSASASISLASPPITYTPVASPPPAPSPEPVVLVVPPTKPPPSVLPDGNSYKSTFAAAQSRWQVPTTKPWVVASSFGPIPAAAVAKAPSSSTNAPAVLSLHGHAPVVEKPPRSPNTTLYTDGPSPFVKDHSREGSGVSSSSSGPPIPPQKSPPQVVYEWDDEEEMGVDNLSPGPLTPAISSSPFFGRPSSPEADDMLSADRDRDSNRDSGMSNMSTATIIVSTVTVATRVRANVVDHSRALSVASTLDESPRSSESGHSSGSGSTPGSEIECPAKSPGYLHASHSSPGLAYLHTPQPSPGLPYLHSPQPSPPFSQEPYATVSRTDTFGGYSEEDERAQPPTPRYRGWVSQIVAPLERYIDHRIDPREHYVDLQEIAEGESGSVFAARVVVGSSLLLPSDSKMVAIKQVEIAPTGSPKLTEIQREMRLMHGLGGHENVLRMLGLYVDVVEDSLWIRMELQERSLADVVALVEEGLVLPERMMARFASDVLLALVFLQEHRIAHRDVRSDNLLINSEGLLKIADFSNAVEVTPQNPLCMSPAGVLYWQAPEMRTGPYNALKVDIWSLGATVWEMAQAEPPFSDGNVGSEWPPLDKPEVYSRGFHEFLALCGTPSDRRVSPKELSNSAFIRNACGRGVIVQLLDQCRAIEGRVQEEEEEDE